jgi:predicted PolB exonuclease-like 3'-5' exonuclease
LTPILAFDIETVPDCAGIRRLHALPDSLTDAEVAELAFQRKRAQSGNDFLPLHLHRVVAISCVLRDDDGVRAFSIAEPEHDERACDPAILRRNRQAHSAARVLERRRLRPAGAAAAGLLHAISAPRYWDSGDEDRDFRYNNYISRYHARHCDLMDIMGLYQPRNNAPSDEVAQLAGLPGKIGLSGGNVWREYLAGGIARIRDYCEVDCANTYLLWLRFQRMRGAHSAEQYTQECALLRDWIAAQPAPAWREFLERWKSA